MLIGHIVLPTTVASNVKGNIIEISVLAANSTEPLDVDESISGMYQCTCCMLGSYWASPLSALDTAAWALGGQGKRAWQSWSVMDSSVSSYSKTTCVPSAVVLGQHESVISKKSSLLEV